MLFFDGVCGGCNRFVDFIIRTDSRREILFSPVQGETAAELSLYQNEPPREWKIVYVDENGMHEGADAVLLVLARLGGCWKLPALFIYLPRTVKDFFYGIISKNRYRIFTKRNTCRVPSAEERERFLP